MKSFKQIKSVLIEAKLPDFVSRYTKHFADHPLVRENPDSAKQMISHAHGLVQSHHDARYAIRSFLDKRLKPGEDDYTIKNTVNRWNKAKKEGKVTGEIGDHSHDEVTSKLNSTETKSNTSDKGRSVISKLSQYHIGTIEHPEHGTLNVYHISHKKIGDDDETYSTISDSMKKHACDRNSFCVLSNYGGEHLKHYSHGHGFLLYTGANNKIKYGHGFGDRGIVNPDNSTVSDSEHNHIVTQTSKLLDDKHRDIYHLMNDKSKKFSLEKQEKMYDEFGDTHGAAHFAAPHINTHPKILDRLLNHKQPHVRGEALKHPNVTAEHITKALDDSDLYVRAQAVRHQNVTAEHITQALNDKDEDLRRTAIRHKNATAEHITKALDDKSERIRVYAAGHQKSTEEHITKALKDESSIVRSSVFAHPNITAEHITKALTDEISIVRRRAVQHRNATSEHITKALDDSDLHVRHAAITHQNVTAEHITKALDDEDFHISVNAIRHPKATAEHITKALEHPMASLRLESILHRNATAEHITKALNDNQATVRRAAIQHPNATAEHITKALDDEKEIVRSHAIRHRNATVDHITKALDDKDAEVRSAAIQHPNATVDHVTKALNDENFNIRKHAHIKQQRMENKIEENKKMTFFKKILHERAKMKSFIKFISEEKKEKKPYKGFKKGKNHPEGGLSRAEAKRQGIRAGIETKDEAKRKGGFSKLSKKTQSRRKRFCSRMCGMRRKRTSTKTARDPKSKINASLRVWGCRC